MDRTAILERVCAMFATIADTDDIREDSELIDDLGVSSMDVLMILASLEEEFHVKIPEKAIRKMNIVGDVADVIVDLKKGR